MARLMRGIILIALLAPLLAHLYLGQFNRALADDFCFTAIVQAQGITGALDHWYNNWTGTYSSTFFQSMVGLGYAWRWVPIVLTTLWLLAAFWTMYQVATVFQLKQRGLIAVITGTMLVYAANDGAANIYQSLYWTSGAITYTLPLILLTFNLGVIILGLRTSEADELPLPHLALSAGLCMVAGGFSPLFAVFQLVVMGLAFLACLIFAAPTWKRRGLVLFAGAMVFAFIALIILYIAPGNAIRRDRFTLEESYIKMGIKAFNGALAFIPLSALRLSPMAIIAPLVLGMMIGLNYHPRNSNQRRFQRYLQLRRMAITGVAGFILIFVCMLVAVVSINALPPARGYIAPQTALVLTVFAWGYIMGMGLQASFADRASSTMMMVGRLVVLVVLGLGPVLAAGRTLANFPRMRTFAQEWDQRNAEIETIAHMDAEADVVVEPFTFDFADRVGVTALRTDTARNTCVADYYGVKSIRVSR
ncbi:MAG: hypothetical protein H7X77_07515 [Anaerolineae bacterium]|nr:hypothetical protein [Anaerolineae bacterium]